MKSNIVFPIIHSYNSCHDLC